MLRNETIKLHFNIFSSVVHTNLRVPIVLRSVKIVAAQIITKPNDNYMLVEKFLCHITGKKNNQGILGKDKSLRKITIFLSGSP